MRLSTVSTTSTHLQIISVSQRPLVQEIYMFTQITKSNSEVGR